MHGSPKFRLNYSGAQHLKMLRARQSNYYQKIIPCTILQNATCTVVYFLPEITAVHHTLKCYVYGILAHVSILKCLMSGTLNFGRNN